MRFAVYLPPQARRARVPALYYLAGPHLHRGDLRHQGRRAARRRRARPRAGHAATRARARARFPGDDAALGLRPGRRLLPRRDRSRRGRRATACTRYVTEELPRARRGAASRCRASARGIFGHSMGGHGALVARAAPPGALPQRARRSRRSSRRSQVPWGEKAFSRLPRRRPRALGASTTRARCSRARAGSPARCSSTRASPTSSSTRSCARSCSSSACAKPAQPLDAAAPRGLRPQLLLHRDVRRRPPAASRRGAGLSPGEIRSSRCELFV